VLSQAIAKGPFADKYVPRALREIISAEAGSNDGFGFPFLLLATYLIRHAPEEDVNFKPGLARVVTEGASRLMTRAGDVGRLGGGAGKAVEIWIVEGWLYFIFTGAAVGAVLGIVSMYVVNFSLKKYVSSPPLDASELLLIVSTGNGSTARAFSSSLLHSDFSLSVLLAARASMIYLLVSAQARPSTGTANTLTRHFSDTTKSTALSISCSTLAASCTLVLYYRGTSSTSLTSLVSPTVAS
jgi:NhaP-type Na+/H+ or K+/H+ antiporter